MSPSLPHPYYGNYGGQGRSRWWLPPQDIYDMAFKWHDAETSLANTYNIFKKALAWNAANRLLKRRLNDRVDLNMLTLIEEDFWNELAQDDEFVQAVRKLDLEETGKVKKEEEGRVLAYNLPGFWQFYSGSRITIAKHAVHRDYAKLYKPGASSIFGLWSIIPVWKTSYLDGAMERFNKKLYDLLKENADNEYDI